LVTDDVQVWDFFFPVCQSSLVECQTVRSPKPPCGAKERNGDDDAEKEDLRVAKGGMPLHAKRTSKVIRVL
jgi:hypothetical protein